MPEIKITNTEVSNHFGDCRISLYGRTRDGEEDAIHVDGFYSRIYAPVDQIKPIENGLMGTGIVRKVIHDTDKVYYKGEHTIEGIERPPVAAVEVDFPWNVKDVTNAYDGVDWFGSDVWTDNQLRIEQEIFSGVKAPSNEVHFSELEPFDASDNPDEFPLSLSFIDIESDDRGEFVKDGSRPIISIVGWNSLADEVVGFFHTGPDRTISECFPDGKPEKFDRVEAVTSEKRMMEKFTAWIGATDPDMLSGWNFEDYDIQYIWLRMEELGLDPKDLSREGWGKFSGPSRGVTLKGRTNYDLLAAYDHTKQGELDSKKLDNVANDELGEAKIEHPGMGYFDMWAKDPVLLMDYNAQDVILCRLLEEKVGIISFWGALRDEIGMNYEDTQRNSDFIEMLARRDLHDHGQVADPTNYNRADSDFDGAYVFPPHTGRARNVVAVDLASLYPMTMWMANASPETKLGFEDVRLLAANDVPIAKTPNGAFFRLDEDGVLKRIVDQAIGMKSDYKELKKDHADDDLSGFYAERYMVSKTVTNSSWGVAGWEPFFLFDEDVALAITSLGQAVIKETARHINEDTVGSVIYGDTDSCYVQLPEDWTAEECVEWAFSLSTDLNDEIYPTFAEEFGIPREMNRWSIEPEGYCSTFFQAGKKKRYAYRMEWKDGKWLDEPKYSVTGFETNRSDTAPLTKEVQYALFDAILDGESEEAIMEIISDAAGRLDPANPDWDAIGIPGGIGKKFEDYASPTAHVRGSMYMNALSGTGLGQGDKPRRVYLKPTLLYGEKADGTHSVSSMNDPDDYVNQPTEVDVLSFETFEDIPEWARDELKVDAGKMTNKIIHKKVEKIASAVGVDTDAAVNGQTQTGLAAFM